MLTGLFIEEGDPRLEHILGAMEPNDLIPSVMDFARFNLEKRVVLEHCGQVDPEDLHDYIVHGGYQGLQKALQTTTADLIRIVTDAKLRGRGGAGFCTGLKWQIVQQAVSSEKVVICNADEGDPGAYMDRTILESCPHQVLEGLAICAHAVGARQAIIYVRAEYPLAVKTLQTAIEQLRQTELVGPGAAFPLYIRIFQGSGAFVCGEETALIQSLEGRRGMARHRPPYPAQEGLAHQPTVINNVKTLASVPAIIKKGSSWFQGIGTSGSPGTAVFSVVGDVVHPGLVEIPMGVTLRTLIYDICGGIPNQKAFKAVQIGGPSGGCLPADLLDTPIDFDSLGEAGAMMGSGGLVVMDEDTCMVNVARYFLDFTQKESCGKCTFCRIGTRQSLNILERITCGKGQTNDLILLQELSEDITAGSLCGLGKTAPNPVLTSLQYFHDEYEAHISEGKCPSKMCRPLTAFYIDLDQCARGCDACVGCCPVDAVFTTPNRKKGIDQSLCVKCGECMVACPPDYDAVRKVSPPHLAPIIERPVKPIKDE
jgi:NADH-quinone oxidoreductase subunit F